MRRPRQQRSQATVEALLEATARILERDGLRGLTTNHVAALAGVSIGSLYEYFDSKDALVQAWCEHHVANARALVDALFDGLAGTPMTDALEPGLAGKYLHNTLGRVTLRHDDTAMNHRAAAALWDTLEQLTA